MKDDLIKQGATAFKAGDLDIARRLLTEAIKLHPDDERA
jgi:Flp pilus assembly protein TadD